MSVDIKCRGCSHHVARLLVVVDQVKEDNNLNENVQDYLCGLGIDSRKRSNTEGRLTVRTETPTISLFCFQWETSFLKANISKLERVRKDFAFRVKDLRLSHGV